MDLIYVTVIRTKHSRRTTPSAQPDWITATAASGSDPGRRRSHVPQESRRTSDLLPGAASARVCPCIRRCKGSVLGSNRRGSQTASGTPHTGSGIHRRRSARRLSGRKLDDTHEIRHCASATRRGVVVRARSARSGPSPFSRAHSASRLCSEPPLLCQEPSPPRSPVLRRLVGIGTPRARWQHAATSIPVHHM